MTIQSKQGKNEVHFGIHLSPDDWVILSLDRIRMIGRDVTFLGYHKRRRRSAWQYPDGRVQFIYPYDRKAIA